MIFSLSKNVISANSPKAIPGTDVFIFFQSPDSVSVPEKLWFEAICASLRMKKSVLILEQELEFSPEWNDKKRWEAAENWSWLSPRALGVITKAYGQTFTNFQEFKLFLMNAK